jgi:hypothetical protein
MLIKLIRADGLNKILNSTFNFLILGLEFLGLLTDPNFLHFDEIIESESLSILR